MNQEEKLEDEKIKVRDVFSKDADDYYDSYISSGARRAFPFQRRREIVLGMLHARSGKVLDIGSGPGVYTAALLDRDNEVWTVDISQKMIELAERVMKDHPRFQHARFQVGDVENFEFEDNFFDSILCVGVIEYLDKSETAFKEIARVLKPGGEAVITCPNGKSPIYRINVLFSRIVNLVFGFLLKRLRGRLFFEYEFQHRVFDPDELDRQIQAVGLRVQQRRFSNYQTGLLRGPFRRRGERISLWAENALLGSRWERLGTNYMVRAVKVSS